MIMYSNINRLNNYSSKIITSYLFIRISSNLFTTSCHENNNNNNNNVNNNNNNNNVNINNNNIFISTSSIRGRRPYMEDEYVVSNDKLYNGVFDGHGGANISKLAKEIAYPHFTKLLNSSNQNNNNNNNNKVLTNEEVAQILKQSLLNVDEEVSKYTNYRTEGSTACVAYFHHQQQSNDKEGETSIITANIGDSRAVLSRNKSAIDLSEDHKPNLPSEKSRVESLGGYIKWDGQYLENGQPNELTGCYRVNGNLALSRSLGDVYMKPYITPLADITITKLTPEDEFIIMATDGLWDVFSSEIAVSIVHQILESYKQFPPEYQNFSEKEKDQFQLIQTEQIKSAREKMASILTELAFKYHSWDNITVLVIWLK